MMSDNTNSRILTKTLYTLFSKLVLQHNIGSLTLTATSMVFFPQKIAIYHEFGLVIRKDAKEDIVGAFGSAGDFLSLSIIDSSNKHIQTNLVSCINP